MNTSTAPAASPRARARLDPPVATRTALVAGGTGLVGTHCLDGLAASPAYGRIITLGRRLHPGDRPRVEERIVDFDRLESISLPPIDDVFCCLGLVFQPGVKADEVFKVDRDYVLSLARIARRHGARRIFVTSAVPADPAAKGSFARAKGEMEEGLKQLGFEAVHFFRVSLLKGRRERFRAIQVVANTVAFLISPFLRGKWARYQSIEGAEVAAAMLRAAAGAESGVHVHEPDTMKAGLSLRS